jgi:transcriptional regulator with XRE-family HTH domain
MTKTRSFAELAAKVKADPARRARIALEKRAIEDALSLAELRSQKNVTQQAIAKTLGVSQANISRIEHEEDLYLSTLRGYLAALGADLELNAIFPDEKFTLGAKEAWLGTPSPEAESAQFAFSGVASVPEVIEAYLRADRNLDPNTAGLLAKMFQAAYMEATGSGSDRENSGSATTETDQESLSETS